MGQQRKEIPPWKGTARGSLRLEGIFRVLLEGAFLPLPGMARKISFLLDNQSLEGSREISGPRAKSWRPAPALQWLCVLRQVAHPLWVAFELKARSGLNSLVLTYGPKESFGVLSAWQGWGHIHGSLGLGVGAWLGVVPHDSGEPNFGVPWSTRDQFRVQGPWILGRGSTVASRGHRQLLCEIKGKIKKKKPITPISSC